MVITIQAMVNAPLADVWQYWTSPDHITKWNHASDDWHTPWAKNNLVPGGQFVSRMEAKDGSVGFDFGGTYDEVMEYQTIAYTIEDGRKVKVSFYDTAGGTEIVEEFEAENLHSIELQRQGWQAILDNFKRYAESR